jgi:hypothetical protein
MTTSTTETQETAQATTKLLSAGGSRGKTHILSIGSGHAVQKSVPSRVMTASNRAATMKGVKAH